MGNIELLHSSCADIMADAVVNAANRLLLAGGGICGVIFQKAGMKELSAFCSKVKTPLEDGAAIITPSFNMQNVKAIIHAVGPNFALTPKAFDKLFNAYYNSLIILKDNGYHSISFPLISSGIFGGSLENAAEVSAKECINAYLKFIEDFPNYKVEVKLCAYTASEMQEAEKAFKAYLG